MDSITAHRRLVAAVLDIALNDRQRAMNTLKRNPDDSDARYRLNEVNRFFRSNWGKFLTSYFSEIERIIK